MNTVPAPNAVERRFDHDFARLDVHPSAGRAAAASPRGAALPKKQDVIDVSGKAPQQKVEKRPLAGRFTWIQRGTSEPAKMLGRFSAGLKGLFVKVAGLVANFGPGGLLERIKAKLQGLFAELSKGQRGSALAEFAIKGVAFAIKQVAHLLLPSTFHLIASTLREGVRRKLAALFGIDPAALVQETFERFKGWLADLGGKVGPIVKKVAIVQKLAEALGGLQRVIDVFRKVADYVDAAGPFNEEYESAAKAAAKALLQTLKGREFKPASEPQRGIPAHMVKAPTLPKATGDLF